MRSEFCYEAPVRDCVKCLGEVEIHNIHRTTSCVHLKAMIDKLQKLSCRGSTANKAMLLVTEQIFLQEVFYDVLFND